MGITSSWKARTRCGAHTELLSWEDPVANHPLRRYKIQPNFHGITTRTVIK